MTHGVMNPPATPRGETSAGSLNGFYRRFGKRALDLTLVVPALLLAAPVMAVVAVLITTKLGRPFLFCQPRAGLHGNTFLLKKFRSMLDTVDDSGKPLPDGERLTRFGRLLRSTSLDELPTLFQVLTGRLSLVGPRPLFTKYVPLYSPRQARRHEVRPGITGWSQVNGRNRIDWDEKFELDVWYVDHVSFWLDLRIIALTFWTVLRRDGISQEGHDTTTEFQGSDVDSSERAGHDASIGPDVPM